MRDLYCFIICILSSTIVIAEGDCQNENEKEDITVPCNFVEKHCWKTCEPQNIPRCIEHYMRKCRNIGRLFGVKPGYGIQKVSYSNATMNMTEGYIVHIPSEAVQKGINENGEIGKDMNFIVLVLNKTFFTTNSVSDVIGENVLGVWLGTTEVRNLSEPVQLKFKNTNQTENGVCVYWHLEKTGGNWSKEGCSTRVQNDTFVCSCNHLSFFAVLINPKIPEEIHIVNLSYISYVGSALSIVFAGLVIVIFICQRKKQSENSVMIHVQLTGSLFLLHISFLCSVWFSDRGDEVCLSLGLILHWCLLATFSWMAIEGFHLYLLLVQVFNIYIKRYTLKLSLVAWGVPTVTVMICGIISKHTSVYGKYSFGKYPNSTSTSICWLTTQTASFITVNGYLGLVMIFNTIMLGVVLVKMRQLRSQDVRIKDNKRRVWKDWVSLLGLCGVLGIPWSLAFFTHAPLNLPALYMFTILNSFQGVFIFLWFLTLTCKAREEEYVSSKGTIHVSFQSNEEHVTTGFVNGKN